MDTSKVIFINEHFCNEVLKFTLEKQPEFKASKKEKFSEVKKRLEKEFPQTEDQIKTQDKLINRIK